MSTARTGVAAYAQYKKETTFGTGVTATVALGLDERVSTLSYTNNQRKISALNDTASVAFAYGREEVSIGIDFVLSNPWWFGGLLGTITKTGSGLVTHKFVKNKAANGHSMEVGISFSTPVVLKAQGAVLQSASLSAQVGEPINVSTQWMAGKMAAIGSTVGTDAADTESTPYTFAHMKVEIPDSTTISGITSFNLNINPNANLLYGIGSKSAVNGYKGLLDISGSFERPMVNDDMLQKVVDRAEQATITIVINNGGTSNAEKEIKLKGTGISFSDLSTSLSVDDVVRENVSFEVRDLVVEAKTSTATNPY